MPINDFKPIANDPGANVVTQATYVTALAPAGDLEDGYLAGLAKSEFMNKTWRQSSMFAAALAQYVVDTLGVDVLDDGDLNALVALITEAIQQGWNHDTSLMAKVANYTVLVADDGRGIEMTGTHSVNLPDAAAALAASAGFSIVVINGGTGKVTVDLLTGTNKLDGVINGSYVFPPKQAGLFKLNAAGDGFVCEAFKMPYMHAVTDVASAATINLDAVLGDFVHVTGAVQIDNVTLSDGRVVWALTTSNPQVTNNGNILTPGNIDITSANGDLWMFRGDGASVRATYYPIAGLVKAGLYTAAPLTISAAERLLGRGEDTIVGASAATEIVLGPKLFFDAGTLDAIFAPDYKSPEQACQQGVLVTLAHGCGATIEQVFTSIICIATDLGYAVGDQVSLESVTDAPSAGLNKPTVAWSSVNIYIAFNSAANTHIVINRKDTQSPVAITPAKWKLIVRAYKG